MQPLRSRETHIGWIRLWSQACLLPQSFDKRRAEVSERKLVRAKPFSLSNQAAQTSSPLKIFCASLHYKTRPLLHRNFLLSRNSSISARNSSAMLLLQSKW